MKVTDELLAEVSDPDERAWLAKHLATAPPLTKAQRDALADLDRPRARYSRHSAA